MLSDSLIAVSTFTMAILFLFGYKSLMLLFVISAIRAFGTAIQLPASSSIIPQMVPVDRLTRISGINSSIQSTTMIISPMVSGALMTLVSLEYIFFIDVITAIIGVSVLGFFVKVSSPTNILEKNGQSNLGDMKQGLAYIRSHSYLMAYFFYMGIMLFLAATPAFLTPLQVTRTFGSDVWRLTAIEISFSLGMMLGGILMASWGGLKNRVHTMVLATCIMGIFTMALGLTPNFWIYLAFMSVIGAALTMLNIPATVLLQEKVEDNYLGRVFSVLTMISSSMMPLGMLIFGPLSDYVSIETLLVISGFLTLIQCFFMSRHKSLVEAGRS